jgi:hypothetical protein
MTKAYDEQRIAAAVQQFESVDLKPAEAMLAAVRILQTSLRAFREDAARFRAELGDEATRKFATQELNDLICELQDSIAPTIRTYNSLLRDPDQRHDAVPGE